MNPENTEPNDHLESIWRMLSCLLENPENHPLELDFNVERTVQSIANLSLLAKKLGENEDRAFGEVNFSLLVGSTARALRSLLRFSREDLANESGLSLSKIEEIESPRTGLGGISLNDLKKYAKGLGIPLFLLLLHTEIFSAFTDGGLPSLDNPN